MRCEDGGGTERCHGRFGSARRPWRAALGELALWDSSVHPWLKDRAEGTTDTIIARALSEPEIELIPAGSPQAIADRVIARDFTIRFANRRWQIPEQESQGLRPGTKVVVDQRLNGEIRFPLTARHTTAPRAPDLWAGQARPAI